MARTSRPTCYRCLRPSPACICDAITRVDNVTRVVIIQHRRERRHPFGTAKLARLALRNVDLRIAFAEYGPNERPGDDFSDAALLYPSPEAPILGPGGPRPSTLVVVDGTWSSAFKVVRDDPWLQTLPRVALAPAAPGRYRIRRAPKPELQLSTIEAITLALQAIEPETRGLGTLLTAFDTMIDRQLALQGHAPRYRGMKPAAE